MRRHSGSINVRGLSAAAAITLFAGCSGGSTIAPNPSSPPDGAHLPSGRVQGALSPFVLLNINGDGHQLKSFYACPATGSLKYVSDYKNNVINIYVGKFAGQAPCGQIASSSLNVPSGLYVQDATHDLYVGNNRGLNVLVFHRGETNPYNIYTDPTGQFVNDVTTTPDGTVIASNVFQYGGNELGSISTWVGGPNGGTFVGNFPMTNSSAGTSVTSRKNGTVYFDDFDKSGDHGVIWFMSCPAGACGAQTQVAGVSLQYPGGMAFGDTGDLLVNDQTAVTADTFELPNPKPSTFPLAGYPNGLAISKFNHHWFVSDGANNIASEYSYPSGKLVGTVQGNPGGASVGIAVDP
jgi:hypothetical protein